MKALELVAASQFELVNRELPSLAPDDVRIRVKACGICGSDVHGMDGHTGRRIPPIIMGHEASGEIAELGQAVKDWKVGDRVTFDSTLYCGNCHFCDRGEINLCDNRRVVGVSCADYRQHGAFAEYVDVPARVLYALPEGLSFELAAMVEPLSIAVHAVRVSGIQPGQSAAVFGVGMIGLLLVQVLKVYGANPIVAIDLDPNKLAFAKKLGATETAVSHPVDVAFEVVGISATVRGAVEAVRKGGTVVLVGNLSPSVELPLQLVVTRELRVLGSCASVGDYPECLRLISEGKVDVGALISEHTDLAGAADAFRRLRSAEPGLLKVMVHP